MTEHDSNVNKRILIIDDNQAIHEDFRKILGDGARNDDLAKAQKILFGDDQDVPALGVYEVECADQGQVGFALVQKSIREKRPFAVAFVDMRMPPGWDGIETIEYLWKVDPDLQMVICTAYSDHQWDQVMQRLGHSEKLLILRKPFDTIEVLQLADSLTSKWSLMHQAKERMASLSQTEDELRHVLAETESLVTAISSVMIGLDGDNRVIRWNAMAEQTFEISSSTVLGKPIQSTNIQWDWDSLMSAVQDCRERQLPVRVTELRYYDQSRIERFLDMTLSPIHGEFDTRSGILMLSGICAVENGGRSHPTVPQEKESMCAFAFSQAEEMSRSVYHIAEHIRFFEKSFHDIQRLLNAYDTLFHQPRNSGVSPQGSDIVSDMLNDSDIARLFREMPAVLTQSLEGTGRVKEILGTMSELLHPVSEKEIRVDFNHAFHSARIGKERKSIGATP